LRDPDRNGGEGARGPLESQATSAVPEERAGPLDQVGADPFSAEEREERRGLHVVEASLNVKEESGDFVPEEVEGLNVMLQDEGGIGGGPSGEGAALKGMDQGANGCLSREAGGYYSLKDLRERLEKDDDPKRRGRVV